MRAFIYLHFLLLINIKGFSQNLKAINGKPPIDTTAILQWPILQAGGVSISNDGMYLSYCIQNQPVGLVTFIIQCTQSSWKKEFVLKRTPTREFSNDSKQIIYKNEDTLFYLSLGGDDIQFISKVNSLRQPRVNRGRWLAYNLKNDTKDIVLVDLLKGDKRHFYNVLDYSFSDSANLLVIKSKFKLDDVLVKSLILYDLQNEKYDTIWSTPISENDEVEFGPLRINGRGDRLVFMVQEKRGSKIANNLWFFKNGMRHATKIVDDESDALINKFTLTNSLPVISKNEKYIFFTLQLVENHLELDPNAASLDVWSYRDDVLQSEQLQNQKNIVYVGCYKIEDNKVMCLGLEDHIMSVSNINGDYYVVNDKFPFANSQLQPWWNTFSNSSYYLVSLIDGQRRFLKKQEKDWKSLQFLFSPSGRYLVYFDTKEQNYYCQDLNTGTVCNITKNIFTQLGEERAFLKGKLMYDSPSPVGVAGWLADERLILIYDNYDVWKVDLSGKRDPVNITNFYGKKHHVKFKIVYDNNQAIQSDQPLLLMAFNVSNKHNGFFRKSINKGGDPEMLTMDPCAYYFAGSTDPSLSEGTKPVKASMANCWIVERQTANEAPNLYLTKNFKEFKRLTDLEPQQSYNWLTAQLISWKQLDGTNTQGILYKPENFDPKKKYPIIFFYYEQSSQCLYQFLHVDFMRATINIPWFVSRGYLVLTPDIHYTVGQTGKSVVNTVESAAEYLSKMPWVDAKRMAIAGHSYGGYETNYLVTHSTKFAAAASFEGMSNLTNFYGSLRGINGYGKSNQFVCEVNQGRLGTTLWEKPNVYIENSPVFKANLVNTPLLLMNNKDDSAVPWEQGLQFFIGLRRLQKKVWMLQYDKEGHILFEDKNIKDFTIRVTQFFDHYLKGLAAPKWMTVGVPARLKRIVTGFDLDEQGSCGHDCFVCMSYVEHNNEKRSLQKKSDKRNK